jgi:hypothetical protein
MSKARKVKDNVYEIFCPGCNDIHTIHVNGIRNATGATWRFNNDLDRPTFNPSIHLKSGKYADPKWQEPEGYNLSVQCHSFVENGMIRFLNDSTHALKGQTIELSDFS